MGAAQPQHHVATGCPQQLLKLGWPQGLGGCSGSIAGCREEDQPCRGCSGHFHVFSTFFPSQFLSCWQEAAWVPVSAAPSLRGPQHQRTSAAVTTGWLVKQHPAIHCPPHGYRTHGDGQHQRLRQGGSKASLSEPNLQRRGTLLTSAFLFPPAAPPCPLSGDFQLGKPWHPKER